MKLMVCGDVHFSQYSSILRKNGDKYSLRLEKLIASVNWVENLAVEKGCIRTIYLGDFFDSSVLNSFELSALREIKWNSTEHIFICGNHETSQHSLINNSVNFLSMCDTITVFNEPKKIVEDNVELCFLPYIFEDSRESISSYFGNKENKRIIFSHNDIKGIQLGSVISTNGFEINDIENNCDLFLNGHLHNGYKVTDKIINVGNLSGQNFSEDAFKYDHVVLILDTDTLRCEVYRNPYAFNFYKIDFIEKNSIDYINDISSKLRNPAVVVIK